MRAVLPAGPEAGLVADRQIVHVRDDDEAPRQVYVRPRQQSQLRRAAAPRGDVCFRGGRRRAVRMLPNTARRQADDRRVPAATARVESNNQFAGEANC